MSKMAEESKGTEELLFFDTFSHEVNKDVNLDLVQFPDHVYITEVRIIPLGARVKAAVPGGVRLGATNPSKFHIEFFVNDLGKPGASTFECFGDFEYSENDCINLECLKKGENVKQIPTDGLVLRGWYTTITLAVYGTLTKSITEQETTNPPAAVQPIPITSSVSVQITTGDKNQINAQADWRAEEIQPQANARDELYVAPYVEEYENHAYPQTSYYDDHSKKDARQIRETASSESDWDRDEREELARRREGEKSPDRQLPNTAIPKTRECSRTFSRSSSREREYVRSAKRDWSHSPEYRHSRHSRALTYERGKKEISREHDKRSPDNDSKRPRTPPIISPRRPRTPDRPTSSLGGSLEDIHYKSKTDFYEKHKYNEKEQPIRVIDHMAEDRSKMVSPTAIADIQIDSPACAEDDAMSQGEPFEPILSDEEIGDETESQFDLEYDFCEFEDITKHFDPSTAILEEFIENDKNGREIDISMRILQKCKLRGDILSFDNFETLSLETKENWVHSAEQFIHVLHLIHNFSYPKRNAILTCLIEENLDILIIWIKIGLNFNCAMSQNQPGYKIRHIKIGARLTELLCCQNSIMQLLLYQEEFDIFKELFVLYEQKYMALSIKLMLIKAMYSCLDSKIAVEYFLNEGSITGYQKLVITLQNNPLTRAKFALKSLLKKVTLYESLQVIREIVTNFFLLENYNEENKSSDIQLLKLSLEEVLKAYTWDEISYTQPKRFLPVTTKFEIVKDSAATKCTNFTFYSYFTIHVFLEVLLLLVSNQEHLPEVIFDQALDIISALSKTLHGLDYLKHNIPTTRILVKCLMGSTNDNSIDLPDEIHSIADSRNYELGIEIAYKIKTKYCLDTIVHINDMEELTDNLHIFYSLTSNPYGRIHVVNTIRMQNNIRILLNLIDKEKQEEAPRQNSNSIVKLKSPIIGYAVDLIDFTIKNSPNVDYLEENGNALLNLIKNHDIYESSVSLILQELAIYLKPLEMSNVFSYDNINPLCELLKRSIEFITTFPGDLIMALRFINHLAIPKFDDDKNPEHRELKYKFVVLQFYSADGIAILISILEKLNTYFEQPGLHISSLATNQGILATQIILPAVQIIRKMLTYVIQSRNTQFKDLIAVEHLLKTYNLMEHVKQKCAASADAILIKEEIIKTLLAYTQPTPTDGVDTESVHKSLWTQMIGEVIKHILSGPYTYIPGLRALSELLPIALPVYTEKPLSETEITRLKTERQLWSAHLHPKSNILTEMIQTVCTSSFPDLLTVFSYTCLQLADLGPNMSLVVSKAIIELLLTNPFQIVDGISHTRRLLILLSTLLEHPQIKVSVLSILSGKLIEFLVGILVANNADTFSSQEYVYTIFETLLDGNKCISYDSQRKKIFSFTCGLPTKEILPAIISAILDHAVLPTSMMQCKIMTFRILSNLTKYDYTLFLLRSLLEKRKEQLLLLIEHFTTLSENPKLLTVLSAFFVFLQTCMQINGPYVSPHRTIVFTSSELATILSWPMTSADDKLHPLLDLQNSINKLNADTMKDDVINKLRTVLNLLEENSNSDMQEMSEPNFPTADGIVEQYNARQIYVLTNKQNKEHCNNFLTYQFPTKSNSDEIDKITCDLSEVIKTCLPPETNITSECKRLLHLSASPQSNRERTTTAPCFRTRRVEVEPTTGRPEKKIYVTRGRGFPRTPPTRGDLFRSRPPNTSRPPSLHVDDFLALETCGAQPTGPTGYNKLSRDMIGIRGTRGGRGRGFGTERGRLSSSNTTTGGYRQANRRTNSPSTWQSHVGMDPSVAPPPQHFRTATAEPVVTPHFQGDYTQQTHFGGPPRGRMRGGPRPPRNFAR